MAKIFSNPTVAPLVFDGKGWEFDYRPSVQGVSNIREAADFAVRYETSTGSYQVKVPLLGEGILHQTFPERVDDQGTVYGASVGSDAAKLTNRSELLVLRPDAPATRFNNVSWITWLTSQQIGGGLERLSYGIIGLAQSTAPTDFPAAGSTDFAGSLLAHMAGNSADWTTGSAQLKVDFAARTASGTMTLTHICMMGCMYPTTELRLANVTLDPAARTFRGDVIGAGQQRNGSFSGVFAGPRAGEVMITFEAPYFDPDAKQWTSVAGVLLARAP